MAKPGGQLVPRGDGVWEIEGVMDATSVPGLLAASKSAFRNHSTVAIDCGAAERIDSAGLALLVEWQRLAGAQGVTLRCFNIARQMQAVAKAYGLTDVLPAESFNG